MKDFQDLYFQRLIFTKWVWCNSDLEEAFLRYEEAAALGHNDAICALGECYEYGQGTRQDYQRALHYYEKAAYEGNSLAKYKLGRFYDLGYGCNENYQKLFIGIKKQQKMV